MTEPSLEHLFLRFRDHGDVRAMASVYDRVATELLLVATHFGAKAGDAEDLLQATFLAAMESAGTFDRGRPLMPWLVGILIHQARRERRSRARRLDAQRLGPQAEPPDPLQLAEDAEFAEEFARKLSALPVGYRQVLTLRWVHGLSPTAVAHSLGLSPETVKTRLRRGGELLRRALPAGFAATLGIALTAGRGLAAVRAVVLERAAELRDARFGPPPAAIGKPIRLAKPGAALAVLVVAGAAAVWAGANLMARPAPSAAAAAPRAAVDVVPASADSGASRSGRSIGAEAEAAAPGLEVDVRWADGAPAPGVWFAVVRRGAADPLLAEQWLQADAKGRAHVDGLADGAFELFADRGGTASAAIAHGGGRAILTIPSGVLLQGRVTGRGGAALPGAGIWLSREHRFDEGRTVAATDAEGRFAVRDVAPDRAFSVVADGCVPRPLERVTAGERAIDLVPEQSRWSLTGVVVDGAGQPVAGALVQVGRRLPFLDFANTAMGSEARVPPLVLVTDAAGRFSRSGFLVFDGRVDVWARAPGFTVASARVPLEGAGAEVELRLQPGRAVRGRLVGEDGSPIPLARVAARDDAIADPAVAPRWATVETSSDADGRYVLAGAREGQQQLVAVAADGRRAAGTVEGDGDAHWNAVLTAPRPISGFVAGEDGAPIAGLQVRGLVGAGRPEPRPGTSDARGAFVLTECDDGPHTLWVTDPKSPWSGCVASLPGVRAGDVPALSVPPARLSTAWLEGRVIDAAGRPVAAAIALGNLRVGRTYADNDPTSGRFRIGPLPAVPDWNVFVRDAAKRWTGRGDLATAIGAVTDVGDLVLADPGRAVLVLEGAAPDKVTGRIAFAGGLECDEVVFAGGRARTRALPPGEFVLHLVGEAAPQSPTRFRVESGGETEVRVALLPGAVHAFTFAHPDDGWDLRLDLQWCTAAGELLCRDQVQWSHRAPFAVKQALAEGSYLLRAVSHAGRRAEAPFSVVKGGIAAPLHLDLRE